MVVAVEALVAVAVAAEAAHLRATAITRVRHAATAAAGSTIANACKVLPMRVAMHRDAMRTAMVDSLVSVMAARAAMIAAVMAHLHSATLVILAAISSRAVTSHPASRASPSPVPRQESHSRLTMHASARHARRAKVGV